jgi:hypothetical protein
MDSGDHIAAWLRCSNKVSIARNVDCFDVVRVCCYVSRVFVGHLR